MFYPYNSISNCNRNTSIGCRSQNLPLNPLNPLTKSTVYLKHSIHASSSASCKTKLHINFDKNFLKEDAQHSDSDDKIAHLPINCIEANSL